MKYLLIIISLISLNCSAQKPTIYGIGDSTMANKVKPEENPEKGWGMLFPMFLKVTISANLGEDNCSYLVRLFVI